MIKETEKKKIKAVDFNQNLSESEIKAWEDMMDADLEDLYTAHPKLKEKNDKDNL